MIKIRPFKSTDQEEVTSLINGIMTEEFEEEQEAYPSDDLENIRKHYGANGEVFLVAQDGKQIVGTIGIKKEDKRIALLRRLFVAKPYRKKKVGQKLINQAIRFCVDGGYGEMVFKATSRMKAARQICQKTGFVQRAKLNLGDLQLYKLALHLPNGSKRNHV